MLRVFIVFVTLLAICAVIIIVDYFHHLSYYSRFRGCKGQKFVFLRVNSKQVRHDLRRAGIRLCPCAEYETHLWLFTTTSTRGLVCGFTEPTMNFVKDARHNGMVIIDCGISVGKFISQVRNIKQPSNGNTEYEE